MKAGKLNKQIVIHQLVIGSPAVNSFGEPNTSWEELDTVWAGVEPLSGRELWAQQQIQSEVSVKIRIRYHNDVTTGMKCTYNSKSYIIQSVIDPMEKHKELLLMCSEGIINA